MTSVITTKKQFDMTLQYFRRCVVIIGLMLVCLPSFAQKRTLSGYVMDAASKETLIGATVIDKNSGKGCATNSYGFYTLTLDQGVVDLQVSYVGYVQQNQTLDLKENLSLNFTLTTNVTLDEVVVEATRATVSARSPQMSVVELPVQQIKSIPTLFGEADVLKAIQLLPEKQRAVFTLRYYDEMPYEEMTKIFGGTEGGLKASYHFAVQKVEEFLSKH